MSPTDPIGVCGEEGGHLTRNRSATTAKARWHRTRTWITARLRTRGLGSPAANTDNEDTDPTDPLDARLLPAAVCCWAATIAALLGGWVLAVTIAIGLLVVVVAGRELVPVADRRAPSEPPARGHLAGSARHYDEGVIEPRTGVDHSADRPGTDGAAGSDRSAGRGSDPQVVDARSGDRPGNAAGVSGEYSMGRGMRPEAVGGRSVDRRAGPEVVGEHPSDRPGIAGPGEGRSATRGRDRPGTAGVGGGHPAGRIDSGPRSRGRTDETLWSRGRALWTDVDRRRSIAVVLLAAVVLGTGFAVAAAWREHRVQVHPLRAAVGGSVLVVVTPTDDPKAVRGSSFGGERRWVVRADLEEFRRGEVAYRAGGSVVILGGGDDWKRVLPGQRIEFRARVEEPRHRDLTVVTLHATGAPRTVGALPWWQRAAVHARADLVDAAGEALPADSAGLLPALVVGDTSALHESVREDFRFAGMQHLTVVSGANFTIVLTVVLFVVGLLTAGPRTTAAFAALTLLMFVVIARPDPSVLRAGAMGAITVLALVTGRRKQALPALCAAVIGLLALWPELAVSAGFALSVLATGALILLAPGWADWLCARGWWRLPAEIVAVSAGAFVVTMPITVALSGQLSLVAVAANILVAPAVAPVTVIGALGAVTAPVWPPVAEIVLRLAGPALWWMLTVAEHAAAFPGATVEVPGGSVGGFLTAAIVIALVCGLRSARIRKLIGAAVLGGAVVLVPIRTWHPGWPPRDWVLAACDVGQGDALALSLGDHTAIVIDVGPDPRTVDACLDRLRIEHIVLLVLTHPHADHIAGLNGALHGRSVAAIAVAPHELNGQAADSVARSTASPGDGSATGTDTRGVVGNAADVRAIATRESITVLELSAGHLLEFGDLRLDVLASATSARPRALGADDANNRSLVIAATTPAGRILLTGDIEDTAQQRLLRRDADALRADILKVPHHGSRTTTAAFLAAVRPRLAVVSAGTGNTFGHPHPQILAELRNLGAIVSRTDRDGDILVVGSATGPQVVTSRRPGGPGVRRAVGSPNNRPKAPRRPCGRVVDSGVSARGGARFPRRKAHNAVISRRSGCPRRRSAMCRQSVGRGHPPSSSRKGHGTSRVGELSVQDRRIAAVSERPSAVQLVLGDEELLIERAIAGIVAQVRAVAPDGDAVPVDRLRAGDANSAELAELLSPSLFAEDRVIVLESAAEAGKDAVAVITAAASDPPDGVVLVVVHSGGGRAKAMAPALQKAGAMTHDCAKLTKAAERTEFVRAEFRAAGVRASGDVVQVILESVGSELRELAAACSQLASDTGGKVDIAAVRRYYSGKAEVSGFDVAELAVAGERSAAMEALRWANDRGVAHVLLADALADSVHTIARVGSAGRGDPFALAQQLGMPPWKVKKAQAQARGWTPATIGAALQVVATLNADVKGGAADASYAVESALARILELRGAS